MIIHLREKGRDMLADAYGNETELHIDREQDTPRPRQRERSTIAFPYSDLDDAVRAAKGVYEVGGESCDRDQLAAKLGLAATGGAFQTRVLGARTFGVLETYRGTLRLTELGSRLCDPQQEREARVRAFLHVPLYSEIYQKFRGRVLPPNSGLESTMEELGVPSKQTGRARQAFSRSAEQAGFFEAAPDRLVEPSAATPEPRAEAGGPRDGGGDKDSRERSEHPFIRGLIETLPEPNSEWKLQERRKWLMAAANIFDLIFVDSDEDGGRLTIEVAKKERATVESRLP